MARFTILAEDPASSSPIERSADTAAEAEYELHILARMVGRDATVTIYEEKKLSITKDTLASLAWEERKGRGIIP